MSVTVPEDVLLLIFGHLVCPEDVWPAMKYDRQAAHAPFTLAAVCQRWRELSLTTSTLWAYFGFPPADKMKEQHLQRLELLQHRVGSAPIDVVFGWHTGGDGKACRREASRSVFAALLDLRIQWKSVVLHVTGAERYGWSIDLVFQSSQWPQLESLSLHLGRLPRALPGAPSLRRFWLDCSLGSVDEPFIAGGYPSLSMLSLYCKSTWIIHGLDRNFGNQLAELVIIDDIKELGGDLTAGMFGRFPTLRYLTLDDARWLEYIDAPALQKLFLWIRNINQTDSQTFRRFAHLEELQLCGGYFEAHTLIMLAGLSNITTLTFCCSPSLITAVERGRGFYWIGNGALRTIAAMNPPIWPHLQRLHFASYDTRSDRSRVAVYAQDVIDFVSARNVPTTGPDHGGPTTARIVEVITNYPGVPDWLEDILQKLIVG